MDSHLAHKENSGKAVICSRTASPAPLKPRTPPVVSSGSMSHSRQPAVAPSSLQAAQQQTLLEPLLAAISSLQASVELVLGTNTSTVSSLVDQFQTFATGDLELRGSLTKILQEERARSHDLEKEMRLRLEQHAQAMSDAESQLADSRSSEAMLQVQLRGVQEEVQEHRKREHVLLAQLDVAVREKIIMEEERLSALSERDSVIASLEARLEAAEHQQKCAVDETRAAEEEKNRAVEMQMSLEKRLDEALGQLESLRNALARPPLCPTHSTATPPNAPALLASPAGTAAVEKNEPKMKRARLEAARQQFRSVSFAEPVTADSRSNRLSELEEMQQQLQQRKKAPGSSQ